MPAPVKFIYFDIGGVLLRVRPFFKDLAEKTGIKTDALIKSWGKFDAVSCRGIRTGQQVWQEYTSEINHPELSSLNFTEIFTGSFKPILASHKLAHELVKKYPIGILSNTQLETFAENYKQKKVPNIDYAAVIESCATGHIKPEKEIYQIAQYSADTPPQNILFIDDSKKYISAAQKQGWQGIVFDKNNPQKSVNEIERYLGI